MSFNMLKKNVNLQDKWEEFNEKGIEVLTSFLTENIETEGKIHEVKDSKVFTNKEFAVLYSIIYNLCVIPKGNFTKKLYLRYVEVNIKYLQDHVLPDLLEVSGAILLKKLSTHWDQFINIFVKWLGKCFHYLNQHYVKQNSLETVSQKGESLFKVQVFMNIKVNVYKSILSEFEKERDEKIVDTHSLKQIIIMIIKFRQKG